MGRLPEAVVWDLDGTLIDSAPDICLALNAVLTESGMESQEVESVRTMIGNGVQKLVERGFAAVGRELSDKELDTKVRTFMAHYSANPTAHTRLYPGVADTLQSLATAGVKQGLCTNKPEAIGPLLGESTERVSAAMKEIQNPYMPLLKRTRGRLISNGLKTVSYTHLTLPTITE